MNGLEGGELTGCLPIFGQGKIEKRRSDIEVTQTTVCDNMRGEKEQDKQELIPNQETAEGRKTPQHHALTSNQGAAKKGGRWCVNRSDRISAHDQVRTTVK